MKKKQMLVIWCSALAIISSVATAVAALLIRPAAETDTSLAAYQTIDEVTAIHRSLGWSIVSAPAHGKRYRLCGGTQSDPTSGVPTMSGSFGTGNRSVSYEIDVPEGELYAVEGLDPIDGGPLKYVVFERPLEQ